MIRTVIRTLSNDSVNDAKIASSCLLATQQFVVFDGLRNAEPKVSAVRGTLSADLENLLESVADDLSTLLAATIKSFDPPALEV